MTRFDVMIGSRVVASVRADSLPHVCRLLDPDGILITKMIAYLPNGKIKVFFLDPL